MHWDSITERAYLKNVRPLRYAGMTDVEYAIHALKVVRAVAWDRASWGLPR